MNYIFDIMSKMKTFLLTCIIMLILYSIGNMVYDTNDDMAMVAIVSGQYANIALPDGIFLSPLLSYILYYLYKAIPYLPWYGMILYTYQLMACYCFYSTVRQAFKDNKSRIIVIVSFLALYTYIFYRLNFASTSLFLWFSVLIYLVAMFLLRPQQNSKNILLFCGFAMGFSYLLRPSMIAIAIAFSIPLFIILFLVEKPKKILYILIPIISLVVVNQYIFMTQINNADYKEFLVYNHIRSDFLDTNKGEMNERTYEALNNAGWHIEDYKVAKEWWLYDEEVFATEKIDKFLEINAHTLISIHDITKIFTSPFVILLCGGVLIYRFKTNSTNISIEKKRFIYGILIKSVGIIILLTMALATIRFPMRVKIPIYILILCYMILLKLTKTNDINHEYRSKKNMLSYFLILVIITTFIISHKKLERQALEGYNFQQYTIESYNSVIELQATDIIFVPLNIKTIINTVSPLYEYRGIPHYNSIPAGWMIRSPIYYQYLKKLGISNGRELMTYIIDNDKVVLSYYWAEDNQLVDDFIRFINSHYAPLNKRLALEIVMDKRRISIGEPEGWIFYKIVTQDL
jgi:hypothetical protein